MSDIPLLLIEDDAAVARSLREGLIDAGFAVTWKTTGADGVQYAQAYQPQLIILDVRLPDGLGFDFCRRLRELGLRQPIMMLTARRDETDKVLGLEMGADDYVTKPYSLRELISRLRALHRRAYGDLSSADADVIYVRDMIIDRTRAQVRRGDQPIALTPIEFRLFNYLAQHPGQALTRAQILDAVWGYAADVDSERAVNVHIRRLREKVEIDPGRPSLILTVPGIGYRLAKN
ncbi:MAG: response regulator transcription factor [Chloroflexi bacterium]|nr:response regulator transcription factor [Chloroflexota bacterium]